MKIFSLANRYYNKYKNYFDPYGEYKLLRDNKPSTNEKGNILITIVGGAYGHLFEGLYARKAELNGYTPYILTCEGYLDYCDANPKMLKHNTLRCFKCQAQIDDFVKAFGGVNCPYSKYLT